MADLTISVAGTQVPVYLAPAPDAVLDAAALAALAGKASITDLASSAAGKGAAMIAKGQSTVDEVIIKTPYEFGAGILAVGADAKLVLQTFLNSLGNGVHGRWQGGPYTISGRLTLINKDNFEISGQCTIKMAAGAGGANPDENYSILLMQGCTNFSIEGLIFDGNRANRTTIEASGHLLRLIGGSNGLFKRCTFKDGTTDGLYVDATDPATLSAYATDMVFEDCVFSGNYRNGGGIIGAVRPQFIRCRCINSLGTAPQAGLDFEPNVANVFGVVDPLVDGCEFTGNTGYGLVLTGAAGSGGTVRPRIQNCWSGGNGDGFIQVDRASGVLIANPRAFNHSTIASGTKGLIEITANASDVTITSPRFANITVSGAGASCIHSSAPDTTVTDFRGKSIACGALNLPGAGAQIAGARVLDSTFAGAAIALTGARAHAAGIDVRRHSGTSGLQASAAGLDLDGAYFEDCSGTYSLYCDSGCTGYAVRNTTVNQTVSVPGGAYAIRLNNAPDIIENVRAKGGYTTTNIFFASAATFSGSKVSCISPDPFKGSATINPASIAAQASTTATIAMTYANTNDRVFIQPQIDLGGLALTAYVSTTGTVTYRLTNPTAAAIDLASATWDFYLVKQ